MTSYGQNGLYEDILLVRKKIDNMTNNSIKVPLNAGRNNNSFWYETLLIDPVNLYIQTKPWGDSSPNVQLELNIIQNKKSYNTFLWYYNTPQLKENYPKAFKDCLLSLNIKDSETETQVELIVEKLTFGKTFFLETKAVIEDLEVVLDCVMEERGESDKMFYRISLFQNNEHKNISFEYVSENNGDKLLFEWNGYKIFVLGTSSSLKNGYVKLKIEK
jgi:hypothetical protein